MLGVGCEWLKVASNVVTKAGSEAGREPMRDEDRHRTDALAHTTLLTTTKLPC